MKKYFNNIFSAISPFNTVRLFLLMLAMSVGLGQTSFAQTTPGGLFNSNAIDLIGQYTTTAGFTPNYTQATLNNANASVYALGFSSPAGIEMDAVDHRLFVADASNNRVLVYNLDASNNLVDKTPDFVLGQTSFTTSTTSSTASGMSFPTGLAYDAAGNRLFVADNSFNRVLVFDVAAITNGEAAINVLGQTTFTVTTAGTTQIKFTGPGGLSYDATNKKLFVAEASNNRVMVFDVTSITNGEAAINVLGQSSFTASTSAITQTGLSVPTGLAYDAINNRLFVADQGNNRVMVFDVTTITNGEAAINVLGQTSFTTSTVATTQAGTRAPFYISYDAANNRLFVPQFFGNRVMVFDVASITNGENAVDVLGQASFTTSTAATTQSGAGITIWA